MRLLAETSETDKIDANTDSLGLTAANAVEDEAKLALGLTYAKDGKYYRTLSTEKIDNPNDHASTQSDSEDNVPAQFSEVQSMMAGGVLVYAPSEATYTWELEQATEMNVFTGTTPTLTNLEKGAKVGTATSSAGTKIAATGENYYGAIDASTFTPESTGLYLFRRNVQETADGTENTYEYSGYYYDASLNKYFALHTGVGANGHSDYVLPAGTINDNSTATPSSDQVLPVKIATGKQVFLYTASEQVLDNATNKLNWKYEDASDAEGDVHPARFVVSYGAGDKAIEINIDLANIGTGEEKWTAIKDNDTAPTQLTTFYYTNDVEAGDTTTKLVDSVTLSKDTDNDAYLAFDFDLNVFLESVQVTMDEAGNELLTPVATWSATEEGNPAVAVNTGATTNATVGAPEINSITWAKS